jgi:hypothetical protein
MMLHKAFSKKYFVFNKRCLDTRFQSKLALYHEHNFSYSLDGMKLSPLGALATNGLTVAG